MSFQYAVFGNPVEHSLSPLIHEFFAKDTQQQMHYGTVLVDGSFEDSANIFFEDGLGCNITVPFKQEAYRYATQLSHRAEISGAVNTIKKLDYNCFYGDNTDGDGLVLDLKRKGIEFKGKKVLIIGAGGATRGIIAPIADMEVDSVTVVSRTFAKTQDLVESMNIKNLKAISFERINEQDKEYDLILNASSSSLQGVLPDLKDGILKKAFCVYDLMYSKSGETVFTRKAHELGVKATYDGLGMLICQAALSFELWRGVRPDIDKAYSYILGVLGRDNHA